jgi:hypothetical protein
LPLLEGLPLLLARLVIDYKAIHKLRNNMSSRRSMPIVLACFVRLQPAAKIAGTAELCCW